ncbi:MAG TPA: RIP metalloprotease RseP [Rhodothermales bacterium]|nr:RIP metalloprotease RseP [Rhodothermales bacterium]
METILNALSYILPVVLALGILVFVHELGHFLTAKLFKMRVEQFSIGFPPKIVSKKIGDTEYRIGATPLGGYVKISGMVDESMDAEFAASEPKPWEFRSKPVWQRMIVISAGVVFNLVLAAFIFVGLKYAYGEDYVPADRVPSIYVEEGSVAYGIGFRTGDRVWAVNGDNIERFDEILGLRSLAADQATFTVERQGQIQILTAPEDLVTQLTRERGSGIFGAGIYGEPYVQVLSVNADDAGALAGLQRGDKVLLVDGYPVRISSELINVIKRSEGKSIELTVARTTDEGTERLVLPAQPEMSDGDYRLGIGVVTRDLIFDNPQIYEHRPYGVGEAIVAGFKSAWESTVATVQSFKKLATGKESLKENLGGPVIIGKVTKEALDRGWEQFWFIVAMLSITLAFINILPIPALDGGHLVFLVYEAIARKEPPLRLRMAVQQVGMVLILTLMAFLIVNDILRL